MSMVPTTEQIISALEAEAGRLRHERDEARELAKRFMLERNHLVEGVREIHTEEHRGSRMHNCPYRLCRYVKKSLSKAGDDTEGRDG